jgi:ectoine hydroxylase-related dioxygenase (phytanoyl-CoA dioxygenase family)
MVSSMIRTYGVKERTQEPDETVGPAVESLRLLGYAVVDGRYSETELSVLSGAFDAAYQAQLAQHGGRNALKVIDEHNTIRAPLAIDPAFLKPASNSRILKICETLLGDRFILNQQNGIVNPPNSASYNQGTYHRDLPYQHFVTSRPLALNALFCLDTFSLENGATKVIPGSHKQEPFPSDSAARALEGQIVAPAGSFIVLDGMLFHSGGVNRTAVPRRAINHVYTLPFIKQQIDLPALLGGKYRDEAVLERLLDYGNDPPKSVAAFYERRRKRKSTP